MLRELRVRGLALLEDVRIPFAPGLCAVTGATGSGKSLLLAALDLLLGGRFSREMLRTGADEARVEGLFEVADPAVRARVAEISGDDAADVVLARRVDASGRNRCEVQGTLVPVAVLRDLGRLLVAFHGQSEHRALLEPAEQTLVLDRAAGLVAQREAFAAKLAAWREARRLLDEAASGADRRAARLDELDAAAREIRGVALRAGEQQELRGARALLADAERHAEAVAAALRLVDGGDGEDGAADRLGAAARALESTARLDASVQEALTEIEDAAERASEAGRVLRAAAERIEADPARLEEVEERLERIGRVLRRHGPTEEDALRALAAAEAEAEALRGGAEGADALAARAADLRREVLADGTALDEARRRAGKAFAADVEAALADLEMQGARFEVSLAVQGDGDDGPDAAERATSLGLSRVEFLVSPNRGEDLRPMARIASGGELARIALAIRGRSARRAGPDGEGVPLLVFDEIDADVGPRLGGVLAERLAALAEGRQVVAVTHLPQVAARAAHHLRVAKREVAGRTVATVDALRGAAREQEIEEMRGESRTGPRKGAARA